MSLVDRIRQRVEVFQPGGDNEKLLRAAADEIESLMEQNRLLMQEIDLLRKASDR